MILSFWNGPFSGDVYIFGGGFKVLWRFVFSVKVYLAWFWQIRLASFLRLFLHFLVQKRWEHWEIVIMDSSNNETTTHVFFQLGNTTLYSVLGLYLCCVLFYVLSSLFVFLAGLMSYIFFCVDLDYLIIWIPTVASITPAGWCHLGISPNSKF